MSVKVATAKCLKVEYKPAVFELVQGVKGWQPGKVHEGRYFKNRGFGWGQHSEPSKLILHHEVESERYETWIDWFFKDHLGEPSEKKFGR